MEEYINVESGVNHGVLIFWKIMLTCGANVEQMRGCGEIKNLASALISAACEILNCFERYPEPGSNRHALRHWCLRPTRLPIPPSGPHFGCLPHAVNGGLRLQRYVFFLNRTNFFRKKCTKQEADGRFSSSASARISKLIH